MKNNGLKLQCTMACSWFPICLELKSEFFLRHNNYSLFINEHQELDF